MERVERIRYLRDFELRCLYAKDIQKVKENVLKKECPFFEDDFKKDTHFRTMRRYYRKHIDNGLMDDLLRIIEEVQK